MHAISSGHVSVVERLVGLGCEINLRNKYIGSTALSTACRQGITEAVKILLAHGADTQIKDHFGKTAYDITLSQEIKDLLQG